MRLLLKFVDGLAALVRVLVTCFLAWMILLSFTQLLLRWFFDINLPWADIQLRQMVLIVGLLGGVLAAAERRHIRIDALDQYLKGKSKILVRRFVSLAASIIAAYLTVLAVGFVQFERQSGSTLREVLFGKTLQAWHIELIIPVGFGLMALFFFLGALSQDLIGRYRGDSDA